MNRIYRDDIVARQERVGPLEHADRSDIALSVPGKYEYAPMASGDEDLVVDRVDFQVLGCVELAVRSLNDANRTFLSVGRPSICQDRLRKLLGYGEFVVKAIIHNPVHGPAQQATLTFNSPKRLCSPFRQPGEYRNLRMGYAIRDQDLFPFRVV